jgi:hypothetical protein
MVYWRTQYDLFGFPVEQTTLGEFDLSVAFVGGDWQWLVRREGGDVTEGSARSGRAAKQQAKDAARRFLHVVPRAA